MNPAIAHLVTLTRLHFRTMRHRWRTTPRRMQWTLLAVGTGLVFAAGVFGFFLRVFGYLHDLPDFTRPFVIGFLQRLIAFLLMALSGLILLSSVLNTLTHWYLSDDTEVLLTLPVQRSAIWIVRTVLVIVQSTYMVYLVVIPIWLAMWVRFHLPARFLVWNTLVFGLYASALCLYGIALTVVLVHWFPVRRLHQLVTMLLAAILVGILTYIRMMRPEQWVRPFTPGELLHLLHELELPGGRVLPYGWAAMLMIGPYLQPEWSIHVPYAGIGFAVWCGLAVVAAIGTTAHWFYSGWLKAREALSRVRTHQRRPRLLHRVSRTWTWLLLKEWWLFSRDPTMWGQLFLLGAVIAIYFLNIRLIPIPHPAVAYFVWLLNVAMTGFIVSALCARFVLPAFSLDGPGYWILYVLPITPRLVYRVRWGFYTLVLTLISAGLILGGVRMLAIGDPVFQWVNGYIAWTMATMLTTMALTMGIRFRRYDEPHSALRIAIGSSGLLYMLLAFAWIAWTIACTVPWVWLHVRARLSAVPPSRWGILILGVHTISWIALMGWTYRRGIVWIRSPEPQP